MQRKVLGKGLEALIPKRAPGDPAPELCMLEVGAIRPNPYQPRQEMDPAELAELGRSLKEKGFLQPVVVRQTDQGYELIAGGRRLEAARLAGLTQVPAMVKELDEKESFVCAIVENLQRRDLNALEEAQAFHRLMEEFHFSLEDVARLVSKDKTTVANTLRLLKLPLEVKRALQKGLLSRSQARTILSLATETEQLRMLHEILAGGMTVRDLEARARRTKGKKAGDPFTAEVEAKLQMKLGTKVKVHNRKNNRGKIVIEYYSLDDLERIIRRLG